MAPLLECSMLVSALPRTPFQSRVCVRYAERHPPSATELSGVRASSRKLWSVRTQGVPIAGTEKSTAHEFEYIVIDT